MATVKQGTLTRTPSIVSCNRRLPQSEYVPTTALGRAIGFEVRNEDARRK
jgi:hypothetical protein